MRETDETRSDLMFGVPLIIIALVLAAAAPTRAKAEEGMWAVNTFPAEQVEKAYGFKPTQKWLDHVRMSSLRLARGCSASFVSHRGLVQTNHHCAESCLEDLSSKGKNYLAEGFYAKEFADEVKCPTVEANQLVEITDVTGRMHKALDGKDGAAFSEADKAEKASIARECAGEGDKFRCDVVSLYDGGVYNLYKYRRFQDVRLVMAPEQSIAFFGGDPDNFEFPRYDLDVSYMRVYVDGRPFDSDGNYFPYAKVDSRPGDLTFTSGHPGATDRLTTVAELEEQRDRLLPVRLFRLSEFRGLLTEFATKGVEEARISRGTLFGVENSLKALKGRFSALVDPAIIKARAASEADLRAKVDADPEMKAQYGEAWNTISATLAGFRDWRDRYNYIEGGSGFSSHLFGYAEALVRRAAEVQKPDEQRLEEYTEANFPMTRQSLVSQTPIYPELERLELTFSLTKMREVLGPDDPFVRKVLGKKSPAQLAAELVDGSILANAKTRTQLLEGGQAAIDASTDPMIVLVRGLDGDMRVLRKDFEDKVKAPLTKSSSQISKARFKVYGTSAYPDATFTLRLSYGSEKGYRQNGKDVISFTKIGGAFERATGADPFALPGSWLAAQAVLNMEQPFNFVTTNDIIGGNSGSPVINKAGEVVGLIFDGNIQSLGGDFGYDGEVNRAVAVNVGALRETLIKVYHADRLVEELAK
jgi:hypothetical protein